MKRPMGGFVAVPLPAGRGWGVAFQPDADSLPDVVVCVGCTSDEAKQLCDELSLKIGG